MQGQYALVIHSGYMSLMSFLVNHTFNLEFIVYLVKFEGSLFAISQEMRYLI